MRNQPNRYDARNAKIATRSRKLESQLADLIADKDCGLMEASHIMGLSYPSITIYWRRIRAQLGPQAK